MRHSRSVGSQRRRRLLQLLGIAAGGSTLASITTARDGQSTAYVAEQDGQCIPLTPLRGSETVEELYAYSFPHERFNAPSGFDGSTFSSEGTTDLQRDSSSILFLYDGPDGLSLVIVHGRVGGDTDEGGTVTFQIHGLPTDGEWVVRDDYYLEEDGSQADSNFDRWDVDGDVHTVDWAYQDGRTDGGAFRPLDDDLHLRIEPAFNEAAALAEDHEYGPIENWELLSGDSEETERHSLSLDRPLVIRRGDCATDGRDGKNGTDDSSKDRKTSDPDRKTNDSKRDVEEEVEEKVEKKVEKIEEKVEEVKAEKKEKSETEKEKRGNGKSNGRGKSNGNGKGRGRGKSDGNGKGRGSSNGKGKGNGKSKGRGKSNGNGNE